MNTEKISIDLGKIEIDIWGNGHIGSEWNVNCKAPASRTASNQVKKVLLDVKA